MLKDILQIFIMFMSAFGLAFLIYFETKGNYIALTHIYFYIYFLNSFIKFENFLSTSVEDIFHKILEIPSLLPLQVKL